MYHIQELGQYYRFFLIAANGRVLLRSKLYLSLGSCHAGISSVRKNALDTSKYVLEEKKGDFTFHFKASNGVVMAYGSFYTSTASRDRGILSVMKIAPYATATTINHAPRR